MAQKPDKERIRERIKEIQKRYHVKAPDLPENFQWLNVSRPLVPKDLKGKVVLLDFWTYCCINCMHVIPDLTYLEKKYENRAFAVIGVHSAKFTNEQDAGNVRQAVLRYGIKHPVVVDENYSIWESYAVNAWPTLVLIDPDGYIIGIFSGEGNRETIDAYVGVLLDEYAKMGKLNGSPLLLEPEQSRETMSVLKYPGKVMADNNRLYISDSDNNRILVTDDSGNVRYVVGSGKPGLMDGDFSTARFSHPQGMALYKDKLLIADTENHAIREVDFKEKTVTTIAGTGEQGYDRTPQGSGTEVLLSSPWDLTVVSDKLYIAMAGLHQIWLQDLASGMVSNYAGTGQEARIDGDRLAAAFAQPSGITTDGAHLYIADSEVSSVRSIDLNTGEVSTVVGGDLFDFGDKDGMGDKVRLQHPLGIAYNNGRLYLADTYNHKLKIIDPATREARSFLGDGQPGYRDGKQPEFYEPSAVAIMNDRLYVADTNNQKIRTVDLMSGETATLAIRIDAVSEGSSDKVAVLSAGFPGTEVVQAPSQSVSPGAATLQLNIVLPPGQKFNPESPFQYLISGDPDVFKTPALNKIQSLQVGQPSVKVPLKIDAGQNSQQTLKVELLYYYCDKASEGTCKIRASEYQLPLKIVSNGDKDIVLEDHPGPKRTNEPVGVF